VRRVGASICNSVLVADPWQGSHGERVRNQSREINREESGTMFVSSATTNVKDVCCHEIRICHVFSSFCVHIWGYGGMFVCFDTSPGKVGGTKGSGNLKEFSNGFEWANYKLGFNILSSPQITHKTHVGKTRMVHARTWLALRTSVKIHVFSTLLSHLGVTSSIYGRIQIECTLVWHAASVEEETTLTI